MVYRPAFQPANRLSFKITENDRSPELLREHYFINSADYAREILAFSKILAIPEEYLDFPQKFRALQEL